MRALQLAQTVLTLLGIPSQGVIMRIFALALLLGAFFAVEARATMVTDATNDFIGSYSGPHAADLDVVSTDATLQGSNLVLSATMNGAVGTTAGGLYVWGFDRGTGASTANFSAIGLPNIIFDSVVIINQDGTGAVAILSAGPPVVTPLAAGSIAIAGNSFTATVPVAMLPSTGFTTLNYTQNLWPRFGGLTTDDQIADFAPDSSMAPISAPEPASLGLVALGALALTLVARRR